MTSQNDPEVACELLRPSPAARRSGLHQERSRQREAALLDAAEGLVAEAGFDGLSMREIARRAEMPIASIYHYFPSVAAIVWQLSIRQLDRIGTFVAERVADHDDVRDVEVLAGILIEEVAAFAGELPAAAAIWNALRSHPDLRDLGRADTVEIARRFVPMLKASSNAVPDETLEAIAVVMIEAIGVNLTFALELPTARRATHLAALRFLVSAGLRSLHRAEGAL